MVNKMLLLIVSAWAFAGCASEKLTVSVFDAEGKPISNAVVRVGFSRSRVLFGGGHSSGNIGHASAETLSNGVAVVNFNCTSSDFGWKAAADGYYTGNTHREHFDFEEVIIPPVFGQVILHEHEKTAIEHLYRIINPRPMYAHYPSERRRLPDGEGRFGFDLKVYDWLPPNGKGEIADFYFIRTPAANRLDAEEYEYGRIEFEEDCGFYIGQQTGCREFPAAYRVEPDKPLMREIVLKCKVHKNNGGWTEPLPVIGTDKYLVLRTRVVHDGQGNIKESNYSMMLGEFVAVPFISAAEVVFNPDSNDLNLEFDRKRNLYNK